MSNSKTLVLIDGSSYLYRAYHAMPDLRAEPGNPESPATGAIRGMINMLQAIRKEVAADYAVCVFDTSGPTFRDTLYPEYKAHRSPMPDDLRSQIEPIHEVVRLLGWPVLAIQGVEADDVIGTLAKTAAAQGVNVVISSGDKDLSQLVDSHIMVMDTMSGKRRDVAGVTAEFGVPPTQMIDYQALVGDAVDNVPGVSKVGPKTAVKWLAEHGSLDGLIAAADGIKGVAGQNLRDAIASGQLALSRQLVTMKTDCDLSAEVPTLPVLDALAPREPDTAPLRDFYERYGFKGLARMLGGAAPEPDALEAVKAGRKPAAKPRADQSTGDMFAQEQAESDEATTEAEAVQQRPLDYDVVLTWEAFDQWLAKINAAELTALDTETTSLDEMRAEIVGISLSVEPGAAAYIPCAMPAPTRQSNCLPTKCCSASSPGWRMRPGPSWASTSSTTAMSSPMPASRCTAMCTTPCCKAMCWKCTARTAWPAWRCATPTARASAMKTCAARAPTRSRSPRCPWTRLPPMPARMPTRPWTCTAYCGRSCRPTTACAASTSWRSPPARPCSA